MTRLLSTPPRAAPAACLLALAAASPPAAGALVSSWAGQAIGDFSDPFNWTLGVPGPADIALVAAGDPTTIAIDAESSVLQLRVRSGLVAFEGVAPLSALSVLAQTPSIVVGDFAGLEATAHLKDGASLVGTFMEVGALPGSVGSTALLAGSTLDLSEILTVGPRGVGSIEILGGMATCRRLFAGTLASGVGSIVLDGLGDGDPTTGLLDAGESLILGQKGSGDLVIAFGATVAVEETILAMQPLSVGDATVVGSGSSLSVAGSADIGRNGVGTLAVLDGATASFGGTTMVGTLPDSYFFPFFPGGVGDVEVAGAGSLLAVAGTLHLPLSGYAALALRGGGRVSVGGDLSINAPSRADVTVEVGPTAPDVFVAVSGNATAPTSSSHVDLTVELVEGYEPVAGDQYVLVAATSIAVPVAVVSPALPPPLRWALRVEPWNAGVALVLRAAISEDIDGDGVVDGSDLGLLLASWDTAQPEADLNHDGVVDAADLGQLLASWGTAS